MTLATDRQRPTAFAIASTAALAAHAGLLLTAMPAAGFSRFTIGLWPAIATSTIVGAWALLQAVRDRLSAREK